MVTLLISGVIQCTHVVSVDGGPLWLSARPCELIVVVHDVLLIVVTLIYIRIGHRRSKLETRDAV